MGVKVHLLLWHLDPCATLSEFVVCLRIGQILACKNLFIAKFSTEKAGMHCVHYRVVNDQCQVLWVVDDIVLMRAADDLTRDFFLVLYAMR